MTRDPPDWQVDLAVERLHDLLIDPVLREDVPVDGPLLTQAVGEVGSDPPM
jgi:hypothetical protein